MDTKMTLRLFLSSLLLAAAGLAAGYGLYRWTHSPLPDTAARAGGPELDALPEQRPPFTLPDLDARARSIEEWDGHVLLINFWATWCPPCRKEIPLLLELQEEYGERGLRLIGVAIDDPTPVGDYVAQMGIDYPILIGGADASAVSRAYGNSLGVLPYTVLVDRRGRIVYAHQGEISRPVVEQAVLPLL
jgi:thiol-disulfide isomerase/thioredoxin